MSAKIARMIFVLTMMFMMIHRNAIAQQGAFNPADCASKITYANGVRACFDLGYLDASGAWSTFDVYLPADWSFSSSNQSYPLLIWAHSGSYSQSTTKSVASDFASLAAANGFIVAVPEYRRSSYSQPINLAQLMSPPTNGSITQTFFASSSSDGPGFADFGDFVTLARTGPVAAAYHFSTSKISVGGGSSGGHVALVEATKAYPNATPFKCFIGMSTPMSLFAFGGTDPAWAKSRYVITAAFGANSDTLAGWSMYNSSGNPTERLNRFNANKAIIVHGQYDNIVPVAQAWQLNWELLARGKSTWLYIPSPAASNSYYGQAPQIADTTSEWSHALGSEVPGQTINIMNAYCKN
jgi:acetyl esterase/lipase